MFLKTNQRGEGIGLLRANSASLPFAEHRPETSGSLIKAFLASP